MRDNISIKGARVNNLKNIDLEIPRNKLIVLRGFRVLAKPRWLLIRCMLKGSAGMWSLFPVMPDSFSVRWKSLMLII